MKTWPIFVVVRFQKIRKGLVPINPKGSVCCCRCGSIYGVVVVMVDVVVAMVIVVVAKVDFVKVTSIIVVVAKVVVVFSI
jgi:hypothetical protein